MGLSASQGRLLLLTARKSDLEYRAQQISQKRLVLSQQLEEVSTNYEEATSNRQMKISLFLGGTNSTDQIVNKSSNLTYATLISGTLAQFNSTQSGIVPYSRTEGQEYTSTSAYRLVDADGAIVVSDASEIPSALSVKTQAAASNFQINGKNVANLYQTGSKEIDEKGNSNYTTLNHYAVAQPNSALANFLKENEDAKGECVVDLDTSKGYVSASGADGRTKYFRVDTGAELDTNAANAFKSNTTATLVADVASVPKTTVTTMSSDGVLKQGNDNKYTLKQDGVVVARYVVDESLKYGTTDVSGSNDGPNYLQDCLRNGKYLVEKGAKTSDSKDIRWNSISWDATANITDSYYTEDDDKAKAKYDRLQSQIQAQDKKLELELDSIETQRSAVTTEEESVQKVIDDNVEGSFKAFA